MEAGPSMRAPLAAEAGGIIAEPEPLDNYPQEDQWFLGRPSRIHGRCHAARVLVWANTIARWMGQAGQPVDLEVVRWSAVLHDVRRLDDGKDPRHGERAASWIRAGGATALSSLGPERRDQIAYCCQWHEPPDHDAPKMTPELTCLKDADSLDRARMRSLDVRYLRTTYARVLVVQARALFELSEPAEPNTCWASVRNAALELGFWAWDGLADYGSLLPRHRCSC